MSGKSLEEYKKYAAENKKVALFTLPTAGGTAYFYGWDCTNNSGATGCYGKGIPTLQNRRISPGWTVYVKNPRITSNDTCGQESEGVSLTTYNSYKHGSAMKKCSPCGLAESIHDDYCSFNKAANVAEDKAGAVLNQMKKLIETSVEFTKLQPKLRNQLFENIKQYEETYKKVKMNQNTVITTDAQEGDADLKLIADNFQFAMWSIIAIMAVVITMRMARKSS